MGLNPAIELTAENDALQVKLRSQAERFTSENDALRTQLNAILARLSELERNQAGATKNAAEVENLR